MTQSLIMCVALLGLTALAHADPANQAQEVLQRSGIQGGLIVHLGCGDGRLTAALRTHDSYLVHGLDVDAQAVDAARVHIRSLGGYGPISVTTYDGQNLPYADNLVNLLVVSDPSSVDREELMRVLCPGGVAITTKVDHGQTRTSHWVKPWPEEIDQWTHHLHGAGGNAVSRDRVVGPPSRLRWTAGPRWARSHGWTPSVTAMVSANGRLFSICDETLTCVDGSVPSKWFLVARDAFSGVLLWKCPIPRWGAEQFSGTPDTGRGVTVGRFTMPPNAGKRLVAMGDTVFVTLGARAPVTALDAASGKPKHVYAETANADEILCAQGRLIVSTNTSARTSEAATDKQVCAIDVDTARVLWTRGPFLAIRASKGQDPHGRLELAAGDGKVFVLTTRAVECLDADSGRTAWRIERPVLPSDAVRRIGFAGMYEYLLTVLVYHDGVVLLAQPEPNTHHTYHTMPGTLYALDAEDGRQMWKHSYGGWGHCTPPDVFVVDDVVWTHVHTKTEHGSVWGNGLKAKDPSQVDYRIQALDLRSGQLNKELPTRDVFNVGHHHRCYRNRITERFLLSCRRGVEFVDLTTGQNYQNHWVRSGCLLGYLPCNGLLYVTPHPCQCYISAKLVGFNALAGKESSAKRVESPKSRVQSRKSRESSVASGGSRAEREEPSVGERLVRGPAYGQAMDSPLSTSSPALDSGLSTLDSSWPTYRHDPQRSGATESAVSTDLEVAWRTEIGTRPSGLVVGGGKVLVAGVDTHTVHSLRAEDGQPDWMYSADARVDSPPTLHEGRVIFGSADGRVHCLRALDGQMVWRLDAAPRRRLVTAFGQLESAWPVPGSVLVHDGKCWFAAGRSSYLDGGIRVYALDPATGDVLYRQTIYRPDANTESVPPVTDGHSIDGLLSDIPATDGANVFIRQMKVSSSGGHGGLHLFTTGGYLDSSWFNRTFWQIGRARTSGLMVLGKGVAYGVEVYDSGNRETVFRPGASVYRLLCIPLEVPADSSRSRQAKGRRRQGPKPRWQQPLGIRVTAMVRAADTIFAAGSPDVVDPEDPHGAWEGRKGGRLVAVNTADGEKLAVYKIPAPPVWDGMAVAHGRLFVSTSDGGILCLGKRPESQTR